MNLKTSRKALSTSAFVAAVLISFLISAGLAFAGSPSNSSQTAPATQAGQTQHTVKAAQTAAQVKAILDRMAAAGVLYPKTVAQVRAAYLEYAKFAGAPEDVFRVENRTIPGPGGAIPIRLYASRADAKLAVWVFFHGGGFVAGSLDTHDAPLRAIANRCDCLIVSVGYRLAPEHRYPAAPNDAYAATQWVADHAAEIGGDPDRIAVGGDGAGGNLAAVVTQMARDHVDMITLPPATPAKTALRPASEPLHLRYQVLIYPNLDLTMLTRSWILSHDPVFTTDSMVAMISAYVPGILDPMQEAYVSPGHAANLSKLPPAFIMTDQDDPVFDEADDYASNLKDAGVPVKVTRYADVIHGFFLMAGQVDAGKMAIDEIAAKLKEAFASPD